MFRHGKRLLASSVVVFSAVLYALTMAYGASQQESIAAGVVVEEVAADSAGEKAGIKPGDVLTSWVRPPSKILLLRVKNRH